MNALRSLLRHRGAAVLPWLLIALGMATPALAAPSAPRLEIVPGAVLMTTAGEQRALRAQAYRASGRPAFGGRIRWTSSDPAVVSVDAQGVITAHAALGSATITAQRYSVRSAPLIVTIARPAAGARLIDDTAVIGTPQALDPGQPLAVGARYQVQLAAAVPAPVPGQVLLGSGAAEIAGRVVAVESSAGGHRVILEVLPLPELFERIELPKRIDLAQAEVRIPPEVEADFTVRRLADGTYRYTPRTAGQSWEVPAQAAPARRTALLGTRSASASLAAASTGGATGTRAIGPFACEAEGKPIPAVSLRDVSFDLKPRFRLLLDQDPLSGGLSKLALAGAVDAGVTTHLVLGGGLDATLTCRKDLMQVVIPVGGPLALVFGGFVPVGAGFELGGKITVSGVGIASSVTLGAEVEAGFACTGVDLCGPLADFTPSFDGSLELVAPSGISATSVRVEPKAAVFGFADLAFGARFIPALRLQPFGLTVGPRLEGSFARPLSQVLDPTYASNYEMKLAFAVKASAGLSGFLARLGLRSFPLEFELGPTLGTSPKGLAARTETGRYRAGETVRFSVDLDPASTDFAFFGNNVGSVAIYRGGERLAAVGGVAGRTRYEIDWRADRDGEVNPPREPAQAFAAFVDPRVLPSPVPLEVVPVAKGSRGGSSRRFGTRDDCQPTPDFPDLCKVWTEQLIPGGPLRLHFHFSPDAYSSVDPTHRAARWRFLEFDAAAVAGNNITSAKLGSESLVGPQDGPSPEVMSSNGNCYRMDVSPDGQLLGFTAVGSFTLSQCNGFIGPRYTLDQPDDGRDPWLPPWVEGCEPASRCATRPPPEAN